MPFATVLVNIEGAISPAAYLHRTLSDYAYRRLKQFRNDPSTNPEVGCAVDLLIQEQRQQGAEWAGALTQSTDQERFDKGIEYILRIMSHDRRSVALESMLEVIWQQGFFCGELCSEVFADVLPAFQRWRRMGRIVASCDSISVALQKLFFRYSEWGDLTHYVSFFFDRHIGPKHTPQTYRRIVGDLQCSPDELLFISDALEALDAARETGIATALIIRAGAAPAGNLHHRIIPDLNVL